MLLIHHLIATSILLIFVVAILIILGCDMPLRYVLLLIIGIYFFGVGIDVDHMNGHGIFTMLKCGSYMVPSQEYYDNCGDLGRHEMHTFAIPLVLISFLIGWVLHMILDTKW